MNWKRITASIVLFSLLSATGVFAFASVPVVSCVSYENSELHRKAVVDIYGNLAEQFRQNTIHWKLAGSFCALETTWKDEDVSYELFLFETNGRLSLAGDIDIIEESCCFDVDFDLQSWWLVVSGDEKDLDSFEWNVDTASKTYARLEHLRSSRPQVSVASEDDERKRSAESGIANKVSSERKYDENFAHRLKRAGNEQNGYRHFSYDANGNVIEEKDTISANPNEETSGLLPATMSVTSNASGEKMYKSDCAWGYFKDAPTGSSYGGSYKRTYSWDSRNLLIASSDNTHQVYYIYDANGERTNKYTHRSETLYFNTFWNYHRDSVVTGQFSKNIYLGTTRLVTKLHNSVDEWPSNQATTANCYYYHSDHLGSAQLITDYKGNEYQRLEYTPYGELWIEKTSSEASAKYLPYKFTGKERDEETGLYYFGARYLDAKYSRWLSTDPALGDYIPIAPVDDEAKKHNGNLPGMGGVFNTVNLQLYHYAANNPIKYVDPDGKDIHAIYFGGGGGKLIVGADASFGIAWDDNGNFAIAVNGNLGVGVEAKIDTPFTPSGSVTYGKNMDDLNGIGSFRLDFSASITGVETTVGVVAGVNIDNETGKISGWNTGVVGGGVNFVTSSLYVVLKHGIGDLIKKYDKLDSKSQEIFLSSIKESQQMPENIKKEIISAIEGDN